MSLKPDSLKHNYYIHRISDSTGFSQLEHIFSRIIETISIVKQSADSPAL